jgi:hypothetical protein
MADPQVIQCASACTVTVVHEINLPLLSLTPEEGAQIALAVCAVWAVGWAVRQLVLLIRYSMTDSSTETGGSQ